MSGLRLIEKQNGVTRMTDIEYETPREVQAALEGFEKGKRVARESLLAEVEDLGEEIYPTDIWPEFTDKNRREIKQVQKLFPNLLARVDSAACRRAFKIAAERIREMEG